MITHSISSIWTGCKQRNMIHFILRMKLKMVMCVGILSLTFMFFTACIDVIANFANPEPKETSKMINIINSDLKKVTYLLLFISCPIFVQPLSIRPYFDQPMILNLLSFFLQISQEEENSLEFQLPILLWWTPFSTTQGIKTCSDTLKSYDCYFTHDRNHRLHPKTSAIFFYGTQFSPTDLPLPRWFSIATFDYNGA